MATHVALLRGINVGGTNKIAMADLRAVVASLGHTDVATYVQSGNVVFTARGADTARGANPAALAAELEQAIARDCGILPRVVVLSREELEQVVRDNPYRAEPNLAYVHAVFFSEQPGPAVMERIAAAERRAAAKGGHDEVRMVGRALFLHTPDGYGRSELAAQLNRASGGAAAGTARNWSTVTRLLALCDA